MQDAIPIPVEADTPEVSSVVEATWFVYKGEGAPLKDLLAGVKHAEQSPEQEAALQHIRFLLYRGQKLPMQTCLAWNGEPMSVTDFRRIRQLDCKL